MHSSGMRTARLVGGCTCPGGGVPARGVPVQALCTCPGGEGVPAQREVPAEVLPPGQTDTCENITFANFVCGR